MDNLEDELFGLPEEERAPPEAQRWAHFLAQGVELTCRFLRRRDGLSWGPARFVISYPDAQPPVPPDPPVAWDISVDRWLIEHHIAAADENNEAERFGFGLQARFEPIELRCGSGYFNALLKMYLEESGLARLEPVADKLASIHEYRPHLSSSSVEYAGQVRRVLSETAQDLESLGYPRARAIDVLGHAIAYYLDDRFNIATRKLLGFG